MPIGKKLAVVLAVVVIGVSVALFFRKDASFFGFWNTSSEDPFQQHVERRLEHGARWTDQAVDLRGGPASQAVRVPSAATAAIGQSPSDQAAPPTFQKNLNPVGALLAPIDGVVDDGEDVPEPLDGDFDAAGSAGSAGGQVLHTVVDGDTLTNLAVRYLGRADAYLDIYEHNRDVLRSADLLPIGAVLRIPPRTTSRPEAAGLSGGASSGAAAAPHGSRTQPARTAAAVIIQRATGSLLVRGASYHRSCEESTARTPAMRWPACRFMCDLRHPMTYQHRRDFHTTMPVAN